MKKHLLYLVFCFILFIIRYTYFYEWKFAIVTPIYKGKGSRSDVNNYRGISVLSPISKLFEKCIASQIFDYFESNNLFFIGQHGFRKNFSCETALHELISLINNSLDKRLINLLLFIDFKKAFDCVDAGLLLSKLFHYGFDNNSINFLKSYFSDRFLKIKVGDCLSDLIALLLGVPQGSVLGPLFFLIFINDLPFFINNVIAKLFADDTTFFAAGENLDKLISTFSLTFKLLMEWCQFNRIDLNVDKTYLMVITRKRIVIPDTIVLNGVSIKVVRQFKLLGVILDDKMLFNKHIASICIKINFRLYSIKKLFYLATSVKVQFFKAFILPYFDYCLSLSIYYSKAVLQKLCNCYNMCLCKLFNSTKQDKFNFYENEPSSINKFLMKFNIFSFVHRIFIRLNLFLFKIVNTKRSPLLASCIKLKNNINSKYNLRSARYP